MASSYVQNYEILNAYLLGAVIRIIFVFTTGVVVSSTLSMFSIFPFSRISTIIFGLVVLSICQEALRVYRNVRDFNEYYQRVQDELKDEDGLDQQN